MKETATDALRSYERSEGIYFMSRNRVPPSGRDLRGVTHLTDRDGWKRWTSETAR